MTVCKTCIVCGLTIERPWKRRNRRFVCNAVCQRALLKARRGPMLGKKHMQATIDKMSVTRRGRKQSPEHIEARMAVLRDGRLKAGWTEKRRQEQAIRCNHQSRRSSSLERAVANVLDILEVQYEAQKRIGRYSVDFYLPERNLVIECDGEYWHQDKTRDDLRDANLRESGYQVVHVPGKAILKDALAALEAAWRL